MHEKTCPADPFGDPRLVALYDEDNPAGEDHDFFRPLADEIGARRVADLGCGTGLLTVTLAAPGRNVVGIDPSEAMLAYARSRPGGDAVTWIRGDSGAIAETDADLVIMSGNVAQHILGDAWPLTLRRVRDALRSGGILAFETRNPAARDWERWTEPLTRETRPTEWGPLTEWLDVTRVDNGNVTFDAHNVFESPQEHLVLPVTLAFRDADQLQRELLGAGLVPCTLAGGWRGEPAHATSRVLVVTARRDDEGRTRHAGLTRQKPEE